MKPTRAAIAMKKKTNELRKTAHRLLRTAGVTMLLGLPGCGYEKNIQVFPEPWQTLDPGSPLDKPPRVEIVTQGAGAVVESGDLVQLQVTDWFAREGRQHDFGAWWLWIGFRSSKETAFFGIAPTIANGLIGLREGTSLKFLDASSNPLDEGFAGELRSNPSGDPKQYSWRTNITHSITLSVPTASGYSLVAIKRVCKGKAQYRTVRLFDDSPVQVTGDGRSYTSHEPREMWFDEAKIEAKCQDGKTAIFQYGPSGSINGKEGRSPVVGYFDLWLRDAWKKLPIGVQLK